MNYIVKEPIAIISIYLWIGFICAISFMEAWLKFRAPGVNLQIGLGIGRLVFNALNKVELVLALAIIVSFIFNKQPLFSIENLSFLIVIFVLLLQTIFLLPELDLRAEMHIKNEVVPKSYLHFYYVAGEVIKVVLLVIFSIKQFKI